MSVWRRFHMDETLAAMAIPQENGRFLVRVREPPDEQRNPMEFYRWNLPDAQDGADKLVQAYYPHECDEQRCGEWRKFEI